MKWTGSLKTVAQQLVALLAQRGYHAAPGPLMEAVEEERLTHFLEEEYGVELFALTTSPEREALDEAFWNCRNVTTASDYGMAEPGAENDNALALVICWCLEILAHEAKKDGQREEPWQDDPDAWKG